MTIGYASGQTQQNVPTGTIQMYAGSTAPTGWLVCNGDAISRSSYASLFEICSTTYGVGDGSTTFNVPDMRAAAPVGVGTSSGFTEDETVALGDKDNDQGQGHKHTINTGGAHVHSGILNPFGPGGVTFPGFGSNWQPIDTHSATHTHPSSEFSATLATDTTNGTPRTGSVTHGKRIGLNFIIKT